MAFCLKKPFLSTLRKTVRRYSSEVPKKKGLVLGVYEGCTKDEIKLTPTADCFNLKTDGKFVEYLRLAGLVKKGKAKVLYKVDYEYPVVAAVGLGRDNLGYNEIEDLEEGREAVRAAASAGCRALQDVGATEIEIETLENPEPAGEGATLGMWRFQEYRDKEKQTPMPCLEPFCDFTEQDEECFKSGVIKGEAQNIARKLADTPANLMTPTIFAQQAECILSPMGVEVKIRDKEWIEDKKMCLFLSVAQGSEECPLFLELNYSGGSCGSEPIILVGKGICFDSGGISLKPPSNMDEMRADMSGAACVVAAMQAIACLKIPANVKGFIPLTENMPSGKATKPGDLFTAMNGKTILVDNTDAEGRLILADALCYAQKFKPYCLLDIATLTGAMRVALGTAATGVFTNSPCLFERLREVGANTGDRVWRFPLWNFYNKQVSDLHSADLTNLGRGKGGGACTAAGFLREFAPDSNWLHLDIASVMGPNDETPYLHKGMTGRPTRTLIEFIAKSAF